MTGWSVRAKVLVWVLFTTAVGMAVAGAVSYAVQDERLVAAVDADLARRVSELVVLVDEGVDPATGQPFASVESLLAVALQRLVPGTYETALTLVDGRPVAYPAGDRPVRLEDEPAVLDAVAAVPAGAAPRWLDVQTSAGQVRLAVVPVSMEGSTTTGTYVVAYAVGQQRDQLVGLMRVYVLVAVGALVAAGLVGWLVAGRLLAPLHSLREAAARLEADDLTERIDVHGDDDVAALTRSYNAMLDRLQTSFEVQRQFLDDAGHELRTPLTVLSGHLQVLDVDDPAAVAETRALLLDETDRMGRLVDDLIVLAQARRPDFLRLGPVDLTGLTDDVLDKARALGERRWLLDQIAEVRVMADGQRLTQALLQLCANAVKFSPPGSQIGVGSAADDHEVRLWVRDEGVGIDPDDLPDVFERFTRLDASRAAEGSGLGLSIVAAIADAHGGRVDVESNPGHGSTFQIVIPARPVPEDQP
jgi:signal transduction histidine kinase